MISLKISLYEFVLVHLKIAKQLLLLDVGRIFHKNPMTYEALFIQIPRPISQERMAH